MKENLHLSLQQDKKDDHKETVCKKCLQSLMEKRSDLLVSIKIRKSMQQLTNNLVYLLLL